MSALVKRDVQAFDEAVDQCGVSETRRPFGKNFGGGRSPGYDFSKRVFDVVCALAAIPVFVALCGALAVLNRRWNIGPLFFVQERAGKDGKPFRMIKFRTMRAEGKSRCSHQPLDVDRITTLGKVMRRTRIDEVPQILNVLRGEMSIIGPRPDLVDHATDFEKQIPMYRERTSVLPGITGYAQTRQGYTDTFDGVRKKVELDTFYVRNRGWALDLDVIRRTFLVILTGYGAR